MSKNYSNCAHSIPSNLVCGACDEVVQGVVRDALAYGSGIAIGNQHIPVDQYFASTTKPSNPKDIVGSKKAPLSTVSAPVLAEVGVAMLEGALKYGRHNYRGVGVRASVYYDATLRHLFSYWEGEDIDPDSGLSHVTKAITSLVVLRDAMIQGKVEDDRPPRSGDFYKDLNRKAALLIEKYAGEVAPYHYTIKDS